ncbi:MAG: tetratricopeptide repeat protein [Candidatus Hodarchaeota archaeon]
MGVRKARKYRKIKDKIILAFILCTILPLIAISIVGLGNFASLGWGIAGQSGQALSDEETRALESLASDKATYLNESFGEVADQLEILSTYAQDLFNGRINATVRPSYYHDVAEAGEAPPDYQYDNDFYHRWVSFNYSAYVIAPSSMGANYTDRNATMNASIDTSSNLDIMFREMKEINPDYTWLYMGFQIGYHRSYPWHHYSSPYDPRLRPWYQLALTSNGTVFTSPYMDASGTGLMISIARKVVNESDGSLIGVMSVDLRIETLRQNVLQEKVLKSGYGFLVDRYGNTIVHPDMVTLNTPIANLETYSSDFDDVLDDMLQGTSPQGNQGFSSYTKDGKLWLIAYYPIPVTNYTMAVVVPEEEVLEPAAGIQDKTITLTINQLVIFLVVTVAALLCILVMVNFTAKSIVKPVKDLTTLVNYIQKGDLSREIPIGRVRQKDEIGTLMTAFHNLTTILRFGNKDYYSGDLDRAFENYQNVLEFFKTTGNKKGMGIALSNIGNVYQQWKDFENAQKAYMQAIEISRELGDSIAHANRLNNLGSLNVAAGNLEKARRLFVEALRIDEDTGNQKGMAKRYRNLGLLELEQDRFDKALEYLEKSKSIEEDGTSFYMGLYHCKKGELENAIESYKEALEISEQTGDKYLQLNVLKELSATFKMNRDRSNAHRYRADYEKLKRSLQPKKYVVFIIDCSGSMVNRIDAAKKGALEIFEKHINPQDEVSIIIFHSYHEILLYPTVKEGNEDHIMDVLKNINSTQYQTAFYDALGEGVDFLNQSGTNEQKWVIALTDGQDNASAVFTLDQMTPRQEKHMVVKSLGNYINNNFLSLNVIIVGVGREMLRFENDLKRFVGEVKRGKYIAVDDVSMVEERIQEAFKKIGEILSQMEMEKFEIFMDEEEEDS